MSKIMEYAGQLVVLRCWCGIQHAVPEALYGEQLRQHNDGQSSTPIYCPLGHKHCPAGESEIARVRRQLESTRAQHDQTRAALRDAQASRAALKGVVTKTKKRIGKGVCPCCNRHFANVERHMAGQHPEYAAAEENA